MCHVDITPISIVILVKNYKETLKLITNEFLCIIYNNPNLKFEKEGLPQNFFLIVLVKYSV